MTETFIALLFAHTLADFVFQTDWMVTHKRNPLALGLHAVIVGLAAVAATGSLHPALIALALVHIGIDVGKLILASVWKSGGFGPFIIDQALHLVTLVALTLWLPDLWSQGLWAPGVITTGDDGGIVGTGFWSEEVAVAVSQATSRPCWVWSTSSARARPSVLTHRVPWSRWAVPSNTSVQSSKPVSRQSAPPSRLWQGRS